jgi:FkbM family methyltransferase
MFELSRLLFYRLMHWMDLVHKIQARRTARAWTARYLRDQRRTEAVLSRHLTPTSNCIDVGANEGEFTEYFLTHAPNGDHLAIEAIPNLSDALRSRFPNVTVVSAAVSDHTGIATFHHAVAFPGYSGLRPQDYPGETRVEEIDVPMATLDELVGDPGDVDFVKIDVEGAELAVLRGMGQILAQGRPTLLFEHAIIHAKFNDTSPGDIFDEFDTMDYSLFTLDESASLSRPEFLRVCERSDHSNYGRTAETNWVARPAI